jgi:hypothetical protein
MPIMSDADNAVQERDELESPELMTTRKVRCCPCGTTRDDTFAQPEREYTFLGTLYLLWGGTSVPKKVNFRCIKCQRVFDSSDAPAVRRKYIL